MKLKEDKRRYHYLVRLHTVCTFFFIIRFIALCIDLSLAKNDAIAFPEVILILELGSSFITFIGNLVYVFMRYVGPILFESDREKVFCCSQAFTWGLATLTCIRCACHREHPQFVLLTRFLIFVLFEIMRFVAFILACTCANRYGPIGLGYAILAGFTLVPSIWLLVVEYLHFYRLWFHYRPDIGNGSKPEYCKRHRRFLPLSIVNDRQTGHWSTPRCVKGESCTSRNLYHVIMFHTGNNKVPSKRPQDNEIVIGYHQTNHDAAYSIAKTNFELSDSGLVGAGIYFAICMNHTEFKANQYGAYICAEVDLGRSKRTKERKSSDNCKGFDTIYFEHPEDADEFCILNPAQVRSWIIVVDQEPNVRECTEQYFKKPTTPSFRGYNKRESKTNCYVADFLDHRAYPGCLY